MSERMRRAEEGGGMPERPDGRRQEGHAPLLAGTHERARLWYADEPAVVADLVARLDLSPKARASAKDRARALAEELRLSGGGDGPVAALLAEYGLSSREGIALMCIAEALLRIPDAETADALIAGQLGGADWSAHLGASSAWFVNASTRALMTTGAVIAPEEGAPILRQLVRRLGEPVVRNAIRAAVSFLGGRFVYAKDMEKALAKTPEGALCSYDMLGEAAWTEADARRYLARYEAAIKALAAARPPGRPVQACSGISVKLSALHPRFTPLQEDRFQDELFPRLQGLAYAAAEADLPFCLDAEEADRLELCLEAFARLALDPALKGWEGLGIAVQAYGPRAMSAAEEVVRLARLCGTRLKPRLVKGAYWDTEVKRAQEEGAAGYPVFTRKAHSDLSFLAVARFFLEARDAVFPCFATHNAHTMAAVLELAEAAGGRPSGADAPSWEFQRLHGMGESLHARVAEEAGLPPSRIYAPVGAHRDLLAYLVRRLLENGANSSFVHRLSDASVPIAEVVQDPLDEILGDANADASAGAASASSPAKSPGALRLSSPGLPAPADLYLPRKNSRGRNLAHPEERAELAEAAAALGGTLPPPPPEADSSQALAALETAAAAFPAWRATPAPERTAMLRRAADAMEAALPRLVALLAAEGGRTLADGVAEVREAADFLRYYAEEGERLARPAALPGPTGESNVLTLEGKGPFLCIAPWNFPLAIFTGQAAAALAAGCTVLAKPAEATPRSAAAAVALLHEAGVPQDALQLLPGSGPAIAAPLLADPRLAGVAFTGSTATAKAIHRALAAREGPIATLIAETGGVNAMVADSSALPEQLARDVLVSAFQSAGQRCSALRILYLQEEAAEEQLAMLTGALQELRLGPPQDPATDIGPMISEQAVAEMEAWSSALPAKGAELLARAPLAPALKAPSAPEGGSTPFAGRWFAPEIWRWPSLAPPPREVFGPILHVATWKSGAFEEVLQAVNDSGFGLTFALHSRAAGRAERAALAASAGNIYINRNQIGAVVGVNPFGGRGLSGTGPKAGGPNYVARFMTERTVTTDLTASGGNASLLAIAS